MTNCGRKESKSSQIMSLTVPHFFFTPRNKGIDLLFDFRFAEKRRESFDIGKDEFLPGFQSIHDIRFLL